MKDVFEEAVELWRDALGGVSNFFIYITIVLIIMTVPIWYIPYKLITRGDKNE